MRKINVNVVRASGISAARLFRDGEFKVGVLMLGIAPVRPRR
jgi:hypothetical protein